MVSSNWLDTRTLRRLKFQMEHVLRDRHLAVNVLRRLAVCSYRRRYFLLFCALIAAALSILCGLFAYGFVCSNIQVWKNVHDLVRPLTCLDKYFDLCVQI